MHLSLLVVEENVGLASFFDGEGVGGLGLSPTPEEKQKEEK